MSTLRMADMRALGPRMAAAALNEQAEVGRERTVERAPKEDGALGASFTVDRASTGSLSARLWSGLVYAAWQHEALYNQHPRGGSAKFLELAVVGGDSRRVLERASLRAIQRVLG